MFAVGTKKKDKKIVNSILSMSNLFDDNKNNDKNRHLSCINISNNKLTNDSQNNDNDNMFGFENIEAPKEEDFGEFRIITNSIYI